MITLPTSLKILEKTSKKLLFEIEPLSPGYGTTIGNALRRVLLSSIEGAAITQVKIKGVSHEFSVIPGVREDVLEITLNLKQVRLRVFGDEPQKIEIKAIGKKEIKAGDIKTPSQVEVINKDLHIASLTAPKAKLEMEMQAQRGLGYKTSTEFKDGKTPIGVMYLDAIFTPVENVAFWVENIRFEKRTDYNKLKMEIRSDGTIDLEETLRKASEILIQHFERLRTHLSRKEEVSALVQKRTRKAKEEPALKDLKLSIRVLNALEKGGIKNLAKLLRENKKSLKKVKGLEEKGIKEIEKKLKKKGLTISE